MSNINPKRMIPLHIADQAVAACDAEIAKLREENARLKAEVERLTKAGDAMALALNLNDDVFDNHEKKLAQSAWNAAKEGKQS
jgi:uncharacterized small protein (DUF1192 family)